MTDISSRARPTRADGRPELEPAATGILPPLYSPPALRDGMVLRDEPIAMLESSTASVVCVQAPAGYGKTTLLAQWAQRERRPLGWITVEAGSDDPVTFGSRLTAAIASTQPSTTALHPVLTGREQGFATVVLPTLDQQLRAAATPFVLVLDDVHQLTEPTTLRMLDRVVTALPAGARLVIASRSDAPVPIARLRSAGCLLEIGARELAMSRKEARLMLAGAGVRKDAADAARAASEGWPAGIFLIGAAARATVGDRSPAEPAGTGARTGTGAGTGTGPRTGACTGTGTERVVVDYLRSQMWQQLDDATLEFLTRTSILTELNGSLCDALLSRQGCGSVLSGLRGSNLLLVPLDSRDERFRYHRLMRDALRSELERRESDLIPVLHDRASRWFERHGDIDSAILHARHGGDLARTAELVWTHLPLAVAPGSQVRPGRWLDGIATHDVARSGQLVAVSGWLALLECDVAGVDRWLLLAEPGSVLAERVDEGQRGDVERCDGRRLDGQCGVQQSCVHQRDLLQSDSWRLDLQMRNVQQRESAAVTDLLRALRGEAGFDRMLPAAESALPRLADGSPWRPVACLVGAIGCLLTGDRRGSVQHLRAAEALADGLGAPLVRAHCLATLALIAIEAGQWDRAATMADRARRSLGQSEDAEQRSAGGFGSAYLVMVFATVQAQGGDVAAASRALNQLPGRCVHRSEPVAWFQVVGSALRAMATVYLGDLPAARMLLGQARRALEQCERSEFLTGVVERAERTLIAVTAGPRIVSPPLTAAELRVLRHLPTQLSIPEIAAGLFVSRYTIKTQALAVYHKLGVSSRTAAVHRARELGLLPEMAVREA